MIYLVELPLMLLLVYPSVKEIMFGVVMYFVCCTIVQIKMKSVKDITKLNNIRCIPISLLCCGFYGLSFYNKWSPSSKVSTIASMFHVSKNVFLLSVSIVLVLLSIYGINLILSIIIVFCEKRLKDINESREYSSKLQTSEYVFCALIALITAFQFTLRPFTSANPSTDSSVFLYIGKMMHKGYVPYKDLFDHKGIILYFIQYLGMFLSTDKYLGLGVWLIELGSMFLFVVLTLKITKLLTNSRIAQYISTCIIPIYCGQLVYEGGNLVEEYALPCIAISLYIMLKYIIIEQFKRYEIIILGIAFGVVFFLRPNMISVWVVFIPFIFFSMLYKRKWNDLIKCTGLFLLGICCILIPIGGYCIYTDSIQDMLEYYFKFNMSYTESNGTIVNRFLAMLDLLGGVRFSIPSIILALFATVNVKNRKIYSLNCVYFLISLILAGMSGRSYLHYAIVLLPAIIVFITYTLHVVERLFISLKPQISGVSIKLVMTLCAMLSILYTLMNFSFTSSFDRLQSPLSQYIINNTDKDEDVLIIGNICNIYLVTGRSTRNKFFYQAPPINVSDELEEEFMSELQSNPSNTIIVTSNKTDILSQSSNIGNICRYLEEQYQKGIYSCEEYDGYYVLKNLTNNY